MVTGSAYARISVSSGLGVVVAVVVVVIAVVVAVAVVVVEAVVVVTLMVVLATDAEEHAIKTMDNVKTIVQTEPNLINLRKTKFPPENKCKS